MSRMNENEYFEVFDSIRFLWCYGVIASQEAMDLVTRVLNKEREYKEVLNMRKAQPRSKDRRFSVVLLVRLVRSILIPSLTEVVFGYDKF